MEAIKAVELTKKYKDLTAVDRLDLSIEQGELFSLLGVNGPGKTTTIKMLSCLTKPTSGNAFLCGKSIVDESADVKAFIAVSPHETAVAPNLTVQENLELMAGVHGFSKEKKKQKIAELSEQFGLSGILRKKAGKLSGGWQRRLSIAMALICEPKILFLDEPTLGLDVLARSELWDAIRQLKGRITIILTTLFSATLIAKDRGSSLLQRLYTTPLTANDFILGYTLPILPIGMAQTVICYIFAVVLGLEVNARILLAVVSILPIALLFIARGLLCGSVFTDKQVDGICGALLTNLSAWLSSIWFDLELVGGAFKRAAYLLPFVHAVEMERAVISGNYAQIAAHLFWVLGYALVILAAAVFAFLRQMKRQ